MAKKIQNITDLIPDAANANKGTERGRYAVEASLRETGAGRSIVVDKDGRIIAGNKTLEAWADISGEIEIVKTDGKKLIVVQREDLDLSDVEGLARKLAYYDNRAGQLGLEWDAEQLFSDLNAGVDLSGMFFDDEIADILATIEGYEAPTAGEDPGADVSKADELQAVWNVQPGDLWQLGEHRLICGDCTDEATVARVMGGEFSNCAVTSPPYPDAEMWETAADELIELGYKTIQSIYNISVSGGVLCWNTSDVPRSNEGMAPNTARDTIRAYEVGWKKRGDIVWEKGMSYLPLPSFTRRPTVPNCTHESILVFFKGDWKPRDPKGQLDETALAWNRESVWKMKTESAKAIGHKAPFPIELAVRCITLWSLEGDVVYEPFSGSGTTIIACEQLGRKCRAVELHPPYVSVALERFFTMTGKTPIRLT